MLPTNAYLYDLRLGERDYHLTPDMWELFQETNARAILPNGNDLTLAWRQNRSICAMRVFSYLYFNGRRRDADGAPECTHEHEIMHFVYNCPYISKRNPPIVRAFTMQGHDFVEDEQDKDHYDFEGYILPIPTADLIVESAWYGAPEWRASITRDITLLTDRPDLPRAEKPTEQARIANSDDTLFLPHGRFADKYFPLFRDSIAMRKYGYRPPRGIDHFIEKQESKWRTVQNLNIHPMYKRRFEILLRRTIRYLNDEAKKPNAAQATPPDTRHEQAHYG